MHSVSRGTPPNVVNVSRHLPTLLSEQLAPYCNLIHSVGSLLASHQEGDLKHARRSHLLVSPSRISAAQMACSGFQTAVMAGC